MFDKFGSYGLLGGRVLLVLIYFISGLSIFSGQLPIAFAASKGMPEFLVWAGFALKLSAGLLVIIGYKTRLAALALVGFTVITALMFHPMFSPVFMKEVSMIGGLLVLASVGAGKFSLDGK